MAWQPKPETDAVLERIEIFLDKTALDTGSVLEFAI